MSKLEGHSQRMATRIIAPLIGLLLCVTPMVAAATVEMMLVDKHDEPRGYCLDIVGAQRKATPERGLQAHTCYSYQGAIAVDQGFDRELIRKGEFRLPAFHVCMTLKSVKEGASLALETCDGRPEQTFELGAAGRIAPRTDASLCVTVAGGSSVPGGGGRPIHLIRKLTVQRCSAERAPYQTWRLREGIDEPARR